MTVRTHRLPMAEFDEIAIGRGRIAGELQGGQLSRRLVQLAAMTRLIATRSPVHAEAGVDAGYAQLLDARRRNRAAVDAVLLHPTVGAWIGHTLRRLTHPGPPSPALDDDLGHFGAIVAVAALAAGAEFNLVMRVRADGTLMLPALGLARPGPCEIWASRWCEAHGRPSAANIELRIEGHTARVPLHGLEEPGWTPVRRLASECDGHRIELDLDDLDPYRDCRELGADVRQEDSAVAGWQSCLDEAWELVVHRHRALAEPLASGISTLVPLKTVSRTVELGRQAGVSATVSEACGAVALTPPPDGMSLAATLVHEFQHSKLSALLDLIPLHQANARTRFYAPWRADPRPLHGLLHGAAAHLALVDFWHALRQAGHGPREQIAHFEFARWRRALRQVLRTIQGSTLLTPAGERFVDRMRRHVAAIQPATVPPRSEQFARDALLDHWITWRLRNCRPDQDWLSTATVAWLEGTRCPPVPPSTVVVDAPATATSQARLDLIYLRLEEPQRPAGDPWWLAEVGEATGADLRFVHGDHADAAREYQHAVHTAPDRADWWSGLGLAGRHLGTPSGRVLVSRPECLSDLYRRLRTLSEHVRDLDALAAWVGGHGATPPGAAPRAPEAPRPRPPAQTGGGSNS